MINPMTMREDFRHNHFRRSFSVVCAPFIRSENNVGECRRCFTNNNETNLPANHCRPHKCQLFGEKTLNFPLRQGDKNSAGSSSSSTSTCRKYSADGGGTGRPNLSGEVFIVADDQSLLERLHPELLCKKTKFEQRCKSDKVCFNSKTNSNINSKNQSDIPLRRFNRHISNSMRKSYFRKHLKIKSLNCFLNRSLPSSFIRLLSVILLVLSSTATASTSWWWQGSNSNLLDSSEICRWARQVGGKQAEMCKTQPSVIEQVRLGIELGIDACQYQMRDHRWNCSQESKTSFERLMQQAKQAALPFVIDPEDRGFMETYTRETSYVQALTSAAITYQVTMGCAKGDIAECGCTNMEQLRSKLLRLEARKHNVTVEKKKLKNLVANFDWGGCEDNVQYGIDKSREFLIVNNKNRLRGRSKLKNKIRLHNEEAGRMAIKKHLRPVCRCHGLTGSCTMTVCWNNMPLFSDVSARLKKKYKSALRVTLNRSGNAIVPTAKRNRRRKKGKSRRNARYERRQRLKSGFKRQSNRARDRNRVSSESARNRHAHARRKLTDENLVYVDRSPNFCNHVPLKGSLGTKGRLCNPLIRAGWGSCKFMCCKRGFQRANLVERKACRCRLRGCCTLDCDECTESKTVYHCM